MSQKSPENERLLNSAFALVAGSSAAAVPFSWDTVPVFQHLSFPNATGAVAFPPARLAWLAKFPLIVIEHAQGPS